MSKMNLKIFGYLFSCFFAIYAQENQPRMNIIPASPPPIGYGKTAQTQALQYPLIGDKIIDGVPKFQWVYGCGLTSAGMLVGYYDRHGYENLFPGECPLTNTQWGNSSERLGECPFLASHKGIDGRTIEGHVDDYYISYKDDGTYEDPYVIAGRNPHPDDCLGDFVCASIKIWSVSDGGTFLARNYDGRKCVDFTDYENNPIGHLKGRDLGHGIRLYVESKGYKVEENYAIEVLKTPLQIGFTFSDYKGEIDASRPVILDLGSHVGLGIGYNDDAGKKTIYLHDTWNNDRSSMQSMEWDGTYFSGMYSLKAVLVIKLSGGGTTYAPYRVMQSSAGGKGLTKAHKK